MSCGGPADRNRGDEEGHSGGLPAGHLAYHCLYLAESACGPGELFLWLQNPSKESPQGWSGSSGNERRAERGCPPWMEIRGRAGRCGWWLVIGSQCRARSTLGGSQGTGTGSGWVQRKPQRVPGHHEDLGANGTGCSAGFGESTEALAGPLLQHCESLPSSDSPPRACT